MCPYSDEISSLFSSFGMNELIEISEHENYRMLDLPAKSVLV